MWPCLPQGERPPLLLRFFFLPCFLAASKEVFFQPCLLADFKEHLFLCFFFLLQMPINRHLNGRVLHHSNPKYPFVIPLKESQESSREERKIGSEN